MFEEVEESLLHHVCDLGGRKGMELTEGPLGEGQHPQVQPWSPPPPHTGWGGSVGEKSPSHCPWGLPMAGLADVTL